MASEVSEKTEAFLWSTKFPDECKQLPYDYLETEEQELVDKCIQHEELTDEEKAHLKQILYNYRPFFEEYNTSKAEKSIESSKNIVKTQSQLLKLIHDPNRYRIDMNYWLNGEKFLLKMRIKPYTDKQYLEGINTQVSLFRDLNREERKLVAKAETKQPMSPEEAKMHQALMDKLKEKAYTEEYALTAINEFLADRIEFIDDTDTCFEENLQFWREVDLNTKTALFNEVRGRLRLNDTFEEELFPPVR